MYSKLPDVGTTIFAIVSKMASDNNAIREGYPTGLIVGNAEGINMNNARCLEVWNGVYQQPPTITSAVADLNDPNQNFDYLADIDNNLCVFYLKETLNQNNAGNYTNPGGNQSVGNNFTYNTATSAVIININN